MDEFGSTRTFPSSWNTFEKVINGKIRKFWVQDLPEDDFEIGLEYLSEYLAGDEPICRALSLGEDEKSLEFFRDYWRDMLKKKCSLACYTELENGERKLVALNCCYKKSIEDSSDLGTTVNGSPIAVLFNLVEYVSDLKNPFEELGIDAYLGAMGLVTHTDYRGHNIGLEVLNSRRLLCGALGLKASLTLFSSPASQRLAEKAGFKDLVTATFDEIGEHNPSLHIPDINKYSKCIRYMYIKYE